MKGEPVSYAVLLVPDRKITAAVKRTWKTLNKKGVSSLLGKDEPHVTLAGFGIGKLALVRKGLLTIGKKFKRPMLRFESIGSFPTEGVLFLAPVVTPELSAIHEVVHRVLKQHTRKPSPYYLPGMWVPHCTLCMLLSPRQLVNGFKAMAKVNIAMTGKFTRLEVVKYQTAKGGTSIRLGTVLAVPFTGK